MRILFVSYYFAPYNSVGAVRPTRMAEWLRRLGHDVHVLTAEQQPFPEGLPCALPAGNVVRTAWRNLNAPVDFVLGARRVAEQGYASGLRNGVTGKLGGLYRTLVHWPDAQAGWRRPAVDAGRDLMRRVGPFDLIYASAPPFTGLQVASTLSREAGVPWVAEFRDLWTDNHAYAHPGWRRRIESTAEDNVLASARAAVTVSSALAASMAKRYSGPIEVITNGYDADDLAGAASGGKAGMPFELVYTGSLYPDVYDVPALVAAVESTGLTASELTLRFSGRNLGAAQEALRGSRAASLFEISNPVPRPQALARQKQADALLFFCWNGPAGEGVLTAKLFEYLGSRRPVLAIGDPASETGRIVNRHAAGLVSREPAQIAQWLRERVTAKRRDGRAPDLPAGDVAAFSRQAQAERLDAFLRPLAKAA